MELEKSLKKAGDVLVKTAVVRRGMLVRDFFDECGRARVHALPFVDSDGRLAGRVTLENVLKSSCLPEYIVEMAPMLGRQMSCVDHAEEKAAEVLCQRIDPYVQKLHATIGSEAPLIKALALMEKYGTSYIFVADDGFYQGVITVPLIAENMTQIASCDIGSSTKPA